MKTPVSIAVCPSYDPELLDRAIAEACEQAELPDVRGASLLLKPNILQGEDPAKAISTRGEVLAAFARYLKAKGASRLMAGESPGFQSSDAAARKCGIMAACEAEGVEWVDFARGLEYECPEGRRVKRFTLAAAAREADMLVSLPKLKTHRLMRYTGAIKNLFGLVQGLGKSAFHLRFPGSGDFGAMLVDLAVAAKPAFCLMDAIVSMEGEGPAAGKPVETGFLLASKDVLAVDWIAASIIGYDPYELPYLVDAASRGCFVSGPEEIELRGAAIDSVRPARFELVPKDAAEAFFTEKLPAPLRRLVKNLSVARPYFDDLKCIRCGACIGICPPKALTFVPAEGAKHEKRVAIDREACITCYCCHEICPEDAIELKKRPF